MTKVTPIEHDYLPAAGRDALLPLYDAMTRLYGARWAHRRLVRRADLSSGLRVLEIGCGTGNLAVAAKRSQPGIALTALDPDPLALQRAHRKSVEIDFERGYSQELRFADGVFDRALSAFMVHHLDDESTKNTVAELFRVIRPGGAVHIVDFVELGHTFARRDQPTFRSAPEVSKQLTDAGFAVEKPEVVRRRMLGTVAFYAAIKPATDQ
ncbi:class I SAM-dependent methyltransferase [Gordonia sp. CPCC 205333]|uniref:class I SAM-dependent methyltransferase n=1 Tax=Gordonia sp. CPCC 205333 TaxID=3140790 RepID=UPI003AF3B507